MLTCSKDVTIAGINVRNQEIALVDRSYFQGDDVVSGLLGLAYSAMTTAYVSTDSGLDDRNITGSALDIRVPYSSLVTSMIAQGLNPPFFSLSLTRPTSNNSSAGGYLTFGGLPPVAIDPAAFASTPLVPWQYAGCLDAFATDLSYYSILPEAYVFDNMKGVVTNHSSELHAIVDSGASGLLVSVSIYPGALRYH